MADLKLRAAILIVSDTASKDPSTDKAGDALTQVFMGPDGADRWTVSKVQIVPDSILDIQTVVMQWTDDGAVDDDFVNLILTTGGTGFAVNDCTPEAINPLIHRTAPGLVHAMLSASLQVTPFAMMSRPCAGVRNKSLILTLPGSPKGAKENLQSVLKLLPHACMQAAGGDSRALHAGGVKKLEKDAGVSATPNPAITPAPASASSPKHSHGHSRGHSRDHSGHSHDSSRHHHHHHHHHHHSGHDHGHQIPKAHTAPSDRPPQSNDPSLGATHRARESPYPMLSVSDATSKILEQTDSLESTTQPLTPSLVGSVVSEDVYAAEAVPAYRASIVDGYAVIVPPPPKDEDFSLQSIQRDLLDMGITEDKIDQNSEFIRLYIEEQRQRAVEEQSNGDGVKRRIKGVFPVASVSHAQASSMPPPLMPGEIARITTGAPLPENANAVVMVEDTVIASTTADKSEEATVEILTDELEVGENVREPGSDIKLGSLLLAKGTTITSVGGEIGVLAAAGVGNVPVHRRPRVGVLSTGDEVTDISASTSLQGGQIRDSNRPSLLSAVTGWNLCSAVIDLGIARDTPDGELERCLRDGLRTHDLDVIITTGGVSMGELDLLKPTIERAMGGTVHFGRVSMKPGKPTTFATLPFKDTTSGTPTQKLLFGLPGNPASALVTAHLFVLPALQKLAGIPNPTGCPRILVRVGSHIKCDPKRTEYHRVVVGVADGDRNRDGPLPTSSTTNQQRPQTPQAKQPQQEEDEETARNGDEVAVVDDVDLPPPSPPPAAPGILIATSTGMQRSSRVGSLARANALLVLPQREGWVEHGSMCEALLMAPVLGF